MTMTDLWILMPLLILGCGAIILLLLGAVMQGRYIVWSAVTCCIGSALWAVQTPPVLTAAFGIAATPLARLFTLCFSLLAAAVLVIAQDYNLQRGIKGEEFPATILFATTGMVAVASATSLLTLFLGLEAMTFGFYVLVAMDLHKFASSEAGLKYLLMGAVAAGFLAFGMALLYFSAGSLESAAILRQTATEPLAMVGWGFVLMGVAFKLSLVPAHLWTPDVYQGATPPVVAFLSGGSKAASILFAVILLESCGTISLLRIPLLVCALSSMVLGNLAALKQNNIRRMLAYSSIAHMGYVALALLSGSSGGYRAALYYALVYALMSVAAFGCVTLFEQSDSSGLIDSYKGGGAGHPFTAAVLTTSLFALAGIPPTAGFTGKFLIFAAAVRGGEVAAAVVGILSSAVAAFYYLRIVVNLYMYNSEGGAHEKVSIAVRSVLVAFALMLLLSGMFPSVLLP